MENSHCEALGDSEQAGNNKTLSRRETSIIDNATMPEDFAGWKMGIKKDFTDWLDNLDAPPAVESLDESPDIYSFYEELAALANETRKGNRKNSESQARLDNDINKFLDCANELKNGLARLEAGKTGERAKDPKQLLMSVVEIAERMSRMERSIAEPRAKGIFGRQTEWKEKFKNIKKGVSILLSHIENLLQKEGVKRTKTEGFQFDPAVMIAVGVDPFCGLPDNTVAEEIAPGYMFEGNVLKLAEVKVSKLKERN